MAQGARFAIGAQVSCTDGPCGELTRVVVDPIAETMTDLVVEPTGRIGLARLVPASLAIAGPEGIALSCTRAEFTGLDPAEETQFVPGTKGYETYGAEQVLSRPYYRLGDQVMDPDQEGQVSDTVTVDTVPQGEVEVRRGVPVEATDGAIGHVQGLVIDPATSHVTHVLLAEGHLWGRKQVAIPISKVTAVDPEGIKLGIGKADVQNLPPVPITS
ncbi:MAG TPA: PRC-barrel domain-containing protein [Streptosporangiaceae bacterium]|jgi:sporulation protein YlmC with PRC-barrel domain